MYTNKKIKEAKGPTMEYKLWQKNITVFTNIIFVNLYITNNFTEEDGGKDFDVNLEIRL